MEAESNTEIQPENEQAGQRIRPFGIIDLIVVTTAMALQFKLYGLYMANSNINSVSMWMPLVFIYAICLLYTSPSPRDQRGSRMPSSA